MSVAVLQPHGIVPTLVALRDQFEAIRRAELTRLERRLAALSPEVRFPSERGLHDTIDVLQQRLD